MTSHDLTKTRLTILAAAAAFLSFTPPSMAAGWDDTVTAARGKVVYWNAWAGDPRINDYIGWVGGQVRERYGIDLRHVKVTDTADVVRGCWRRRLPARTGAAPSISSGSMARTSPP